MKNKRKTIPISISKEEAAKEIIKHGYEAVVKEGVVYIKNDGSIKFIEIAKLMESIGYYQSYGIVSKL